MKKPTIEEVLKLVTFGRDEDGKLFVRFVEGHVYFDVRGAVGGHVTGSVKGNVMGNVEGDVGGNVLGTINGRRWRFVETPKERIIRLIREGRGEEAIKILEESHL